MPAPKLSRLTWARGRTEDCRSILVERNTRYVPRCSRGSTEIAHKQQQGCSSAPSAITQALSPRSSGEIHQAAPGRQIPACTHVAILLKLGVSLGFQFSFTSEVDGLRMTCTKLVSSSHGSSRTKVILLTKLFQELSKLWFG